MYSVTILKLELVKTVEPGDSWLLNRKKKMK